MSATLKITEPNGRIWETDLIPGTSYSIGRAKENDIVLNDRRVSRKHAQIGATADGFRLIDGYYENGTLVRSVNRVFVNGAAALEKPLIGGDVILIGESRLEFADKKHTAPGEPALAVVETGTDEAAGVSYDDKPLGQTQVQISANEIIGRQSHLSIETAVAG